ncbi:hypothetical protein [Sedimentitalea todarodis]|uniref:Uncharacterized protein n=1 Tax=Sedimentitalea todarodis TaxID=1631240 RepID=A0ABU3VIA3_9RHOB|nr:hypothetical protein [Sedimentitalea todarodis]MDU9005740.1 hypothetical protein [Sedimentitalea todarodis]
MKKAVSLTLLMTLAAGCTTVDSTTVKNMPSGELCSFLDPNTWIVSGAERQAIYAELKARNQDCILPTGAAVAL